jgi:hypothetical protein
LLDYKEKPGGFSHEKAVEKWQPLENNFLLLSEFKAIFLLKKA